MCVCVCVNVCECVCERERERERGGEREGREREGGKRERIKYLYALKQTVVLKTGQLQRLLYERYSLLDEVCERVEHLSVLRRIRQYTFSVGHTKRWPASGMFWRTSAPISKPYTPA